MSESVTIRVGKIPDLLTARELQQLLISMQADLASLTAQFNQLRTDYNAETVPTTAAAVTLNTTA
jgi:hypothetical protein